MTFELWRQDDNGNRFLVGSFSERSAAEGRLAELTRYRHKQTYWIAERADEQ
jgi:hypothetical protein